MKRNLFAMAMVAVTCSWTSVPARAHGIWAHIHVTGWAAENLPPGELRDFLSSDPEVFNALLFGAAFTDSGYWPQSGSLADKSRAYSEHTHWEPFIADFVAWIQDNDPPPWTSLASKKRVAFLMGCAAHGLQDEVFDSLFLYQTQEHDGIGQSEADPASDGYMSNDGHIRFKPTEYIPMETLLELYAGLPEGVTEDTIKDSVGIMTLLYVNDGAGPEIAQTRYEQYAGLTPWMAEHYLDPTIPGSLRAEILPTRMYLESLWKRLNGTFGVDDWVMAASPENPLRLLGHDASSPDSWVTVYFGVGTDIDALTTIWMADATGAPVEFELKGTRWGEKWTRLARLQPNVSLEPGAWYTVGVPGGVDLRDGTSIGAGESSFTLNFQVNCLPGAEDDCPPLDFAPGRIDGPTIFEDPPSPEPDPAPDAGPELTPEAAPDAGPTPTPPTPGDDGGCGSTPDGPAGWLLVFVVALALRRRGALSLAQDDAR